MALPWTSQPQLCLEPLSPLHHLGPSTYRLHLGSSLPRPLSVIALPPDFSSLRLCFSFPLAPLQFSGNLVPPWPLVPLWPPPVLPGLSIPWTSSGSPPLTASLLSGGLQALPWLLSPLVPPWVILLLAPIWVALGTLTVMVLFVVIALPPATRNLETDELCEYFSQHLGEYENVLAALEDLNVSILKAMDKTKKAASINSNRTSECHTGARSLAFSSQDYQEATHLEQFVTRFLLKETTSQLQSLQSSLECAMETTAEQTRQERQVTQITLLHFVKHNIYQTRGVRRS
ncbi:N-terminal EF-hand calcium-binding protein 1 [Anabarilius grahami]|uniref:N-terminal EF-hand calcium-binding protein 1 n=1 Tax=Anabarilius grahami TaxID=495550 RepID=A0A3N0XZI2_ANAGA|nr:N-terminal EF-hand calcium-binding protein 1 [Anabarilius grahami]